MRVKADAIDAVMSNADTILLDVREPAEIDETGGYEGAINIPITQLARRLGAVPNDKTILTACNGGGRAARAAAMLAQNGFKVAGYCGLKGYRGSKAKPPKQLGG
jgi:rhodanese-related sulfurtransferase